MRIKSLQRFENKPILKRLQKGHVCYTLFFYKLGSLFRAISKLIKLGVQNAQEFKKCDIKRPLLE